MSITREKLQQIQADARQEHDDFTQNTHKDTTCSAVGSILVKLRDIKSDDDREDTSSDQHCSPRDFDSEDAVSESTSSF